MAVGLMSNVRPVSAIDPTEASAGRPVIIWNPITTLDRQVLYLTKTPYNSLLQRQTLLLSADDPDWFRAFVDPNRTLIHHYHHLMEGVFELKGLTLTGTNPIRHPRSWWDRNPIFSFTNSTSRSIPCNNKGIK